MVYGVEKMLRQEEKWESDGLKVCFSDWIFNLCPQSHSRRELEYLLQYFLLCCFPSWVGEKRGYRKAILIPNYNRINLLYHVNMSQSHCFVSRKEIPVNYLFLCPFPWVEVSYFLSPWESEGGEGVGGRDYIVNREQ